MTELPPPPPGNYPPPPGNYPPPPPGNYPPPLPDGFGGPPANNLVWAILVTVFCCLPLGIVSIIKAAQVTGLWAQGRPIEAQKAADDAKKFALWGVAAGVVFGVIVLFTQMAGVSMMNTGY